MRCLVGAVAVRRLTSPSASGHTYKEARFLIQEDGQSPFTFLSQPLINYTIIRYHCLYYYFPCYRLTCFSARLPLYLICIYYKDHAPPDSDTRRRQLFTTAWLVLA